VQQQVADQESQHQTTAEASGLPLGLQSDEPSAFGRTKNDDDVAYLNIKLSVKFPLIPQYMQDWTKGRDKIFFGFTGVWGFYADTRPSGPVVGKEFNPKLTFQNGFQCKGNSFVPNTGYGDNRVNPRGPIYPCYVTVGYDHDSNGQVVDTYAAFADIRRRQGLEAAYDAISRGWDYIEVFGKYVIPVPCTTPCNYRLSVYPSAKYFLPYGILQGREEELHDWENPPDGKPRRTVDGLAILGKAQFHVGKSTFIGDGKLAVRYSTGYSSPFEYNTVRLEAGLQILQLPIVAFAQRGYMSDLSQYYHKVTGYGVEIEIGGF